jgi:type I restriction enzyme, S subunit
MNNSQRKNHSNSDWERCRLKFAAPQKTERGNLHLQGSDYLGLENIESWTGRLVPSSVNYEFGSKENDWQTTGIAFTPTNVLFGKLRPYLAKVFLPETSGICSTEFLVLEPTEKIRRKYLFYTLITKEFITTVNASTFGSRMPRASWDFIGSQSVSIPPIYQQDIIVSYLDKETEKIDELIAEKEHMIALLKERRSALITAAITGQIEPEIMREYLPNSEALQ